MECPNTHTDIASVVLAETERLMSEQNLTFANVVRAHLLPEFLQHELIEKEPTSASEYPRWFEKTIKRLDRIRKHEQSFPSSLLLAWIAALPNPYRLRAQHQTAAFLGTCFVPLDLRPRSQESRSVKSCLDQISKEVGDVLSHSKPAMDGVFDENDSPEDTQRYADELHELLSQIFVELGRIKCGAGIEPTAYNVMRLSPLFS